MQTYHQGRLFRDTKTFISPDEANSFMEVNPNYGMLFEFPIITLARKDDAGELFSSPLNAWKKRAQAWDGDRLHLNELSLYFDNEGDWKETWQALNKSYLAPCIRAFKSPEGTNGRQLQYTIFIEHPLSDYFAQHSAAATMRGVLQSLRVPYLSVGYFGAGCIVLKTPLTADLTPLKGLLELEAHPLTNAANNYFSITILEKD